MMPPAQASGDDRRDQNPAGTALPTVNWSLVAAATPRVAWPASIDADPWATTSLKYGPGLAPAGTTSCTGIVADCLASRCTSVWPGLNQAFGTSRPVPLDSRCTSSRTVSGSVPVFTTYTGGRSYVWPACAIPVSRTGPTWMPTPMLAAAAAGKASSRNPAVGSVTIAASLRRCMTRPCAPAWGQPGDRRPPAHCNRTVNAWP
jgi:hypothetical protein